MMRAVFHFRMLLSLVAAMVLAVAVLLVAMPTRPALAGTTITVTTPTDENRSDGDCSLREAIRAANTDSSRDRCPAGTGNDTIVVPAGTYTFAIAQVPNSEPYDGAGDLDLLDADGVTILGAGARNTIIDAARLDRVFDIQTGTAIISGVTVKNGTGDIPGGGGISNSGTLTLNNSTVSDNNAISGGGILNGGTLTVNNSTVSGNKTALSSSGILNSGTLTLNNSTVSGNSAQDRAGGINNTGTLTLNNSTVSSNSAGTDGSGSGGGILNSGTATLRNTIVARNTAPTDPDASGTFSSQGNNLIGDTTGAIGFSTQPPQNDRLNVNPLLGPLQNNGGPTNTQALLFGSPAIDTAVSTGCPPPSTDQRGVPRAKDGDNNGTVICDIGAFERNDVISPRVSTVAPTNGRTGILRNTNLIATFSEQMIPSSINKLTFKLYRCPSLTSTNCTTQITNVTVTPSADRLKAVLNPFGTSSTLLPANSKYKAIIGGTRDLAGNPLDQNPSVAGNQNMVWYFTTGSR